ncbi:hypothetical protein NM688_g8969 [Phlebia brevispora]|uniref:Uncharacterized protein n=1 Tax=Phlebia brevispora TaxID=194682 RepID=A0ACC1RL10_9APHY|nr:hypothetical protein NM688_g8969 [Phlebia brevispora]
MSSEWSPGSKPVKLFPSTPHGDAVVIPVNAFLTRVAPPLQRTLDVAQVVRNLLRTNKRWPVIQNGRWRVFTQDPADSDQPRTKRYKRLESVVEAIHKAAGVAEVPVLLIQRSQCVMGSEDRDQHTLPDAYFSRGRCARDWTDVAAFGELHEKDSDADFEENVRKVTESMHHCMKKDARRRFVYAFTINNATIRLWFCDRSQILVTEPFKFITDHHTLVHFFLSVMYASSSDLGLDSTMTLSEDGRHYDIKLCSSDHARTYRTLKLLSPLEFYLLSKATRVWKAVRVEEGKEVGPPVVLKDMWRYPHLESEGMILKNLLDDLYKDSGQANSFFVAIEEYGDVYLDEECTILDCTSVFNPADSIRPPPLTCRADLLARGPRGRLARVHHRSMIKEVCKPLDTETSLAKVFQHLSQITQTLRTLHLAGWVHRDISPANILLKNDGTALLADLEYAKPMDTAPEQRTGTPGFIALEVVIGKYRFPPRKDSLPPSGEHTLMEKVRETKDGKPVFKDAPKAVPTYHSVDGEGLPDVRYNPLHDLESLWWVAVHFIATQEIYNADGAESEPFVASAAQRQYAAELFDDTGRRRPDRGAPLRSGAHS